MNHVCLMGRLTAEPELRRTQSGKDVLSFTLAINRGYGDKRSADFPSCVAWEGTAKFISQYFRKGSLIAVEGSLRTRSYEDKNGNKRFIMEVLVDNAHFTGERSNKSVDDTDQYGEFTPPPPPLPASESAYSSSYHNELKMDYLEVPEDEDLPF